MMRIQNALQFIPAHERDLWVAMAMASDVKSVHRNNVVIGCGSPDEARGKSRNTARYAAFSILATSYGSSDGMAYAMPVTLCVPPVFHTHSSCRPMWKWIGSCSKAQLDSSMSTNLHKVCKKCGGTDFTEGGICRPCKKLITDKYKSKNHEAILDAQRKRYAENSDSINLKNLQWKRDHKQQVKDSNAAYRASNPDKVKAATKASIAKNPEKARAKKAAWRAENLDKSKALVAAWVAANFERKKASNKAHRAANPEAYRVYCQNREAKKRANGGTLSKGIAAKLYKLQKGKCACCGLPLGENYHLDHIMPIALGGPNTDDNIQLLRQQCNNQKRAKHPVDFMQTRGFLL